jgi:hypothetical protein
MVFVADEIPAELRRIVEFLNGQMDPAEVLAVEIRQYVGQQLTTLVPRVIGQTSEAERKKSAGGRDERTWDEASFFSEVSNRWGSQQAEVARRIFEWAQQNKLRIDWGKRNQDGSMTPLLNHNGAWHSLIGVWTYGTVEIPFQYMKSKPPFDAETKRQELRDLLNKIPGVEEIPTDGLTRRPRILLSALTDGGALKEFMGVLDWVVQEIKAS